MRLFKVIAGTSLFLGACAMPAQVERPVSDPETLETVAPELAAPPPEVDARTVDEFDTTTEDQRRAATEVDENGTLLGSGIASLGDVTRGGLWLETAMVSEAARGRVEVAETGAAIAVELLPGNGESLRLSLAAMRTLEVPLTDLVEVSVYKLQ